MVNTTYAALRTVVGVAKEAVRGTGVAPTFYPAVKKYDPHDKVLKLIDGGWRGSMSEDYGMQNGPRSSEIDCSGDVFADSIGWWLVGVLGSDTVTGASDPYTHTSGLDNTTDGQPPSYSWTDNEAGLQARRIAGAVVNELTLKFDAAGLMNFDAKMTGMASATQTQPTAAYTTTVPIPNWLGAVTIGGASNVAIQNMEVAMKRKTVEAVFTLGAQDPYTIHVGGLEVTTKMTLVAQDESRLLAYLNGSQEAVVATFTQSANRVLALQMSQHYTDDAKITRGKSYLEVEVTGRAMANATDATGTGGGGLSPVLATLKNALPTGTYA
jgi:hypothetical protein